MPYRPPTATAPPPKPPPSPEDNRPGIGQPPRKRKQPPAQAPSPEDVQHPSFSSPTAPPPSGPPIPVMQKYGYHGSIHDLNGRVEAIADAYRRKFGMLPPWGLTFDLLRAPVDDFHSLFAPVPHSGAVARARSALGHGPDPLKPTVAPQKAFVGDLVQAVRNNELDDFIRSNPDEFKALLADKFWTSKAARELGYPTAEQFRKNAASPAPTGREAAKGSRQAIQQASILALNPDFGKPYNPMGTVSLGITQIAGALAYSPAGIYFTGRAISGDIAAATQGDYSFKRSRAFGKAVGKSAYADVRHPAENPGYLFLDVLGVVSAGAGTALRTTRALEAARAGEGVGAAARTLASRPVGGTYELRKGGHAEHVLLYENPVAQVVQRAGLKLRQRALDTRDVHPTARQPITSGRAVDLSSEAKLAREAEARKRVERAIASTYTSELEKAAGWSLVSSHVFSRLPHVVRRAGEKLPGHAPFGLTRGEQKAIQVLATDDPNPLALHRDFHERMKLTPEIGDDFGLTPEQFIANHDRHLGDLKLAETALGNLAEGKARDRFASAVDETRRVIAEQQRLKVEELGLLPDTAERRIIMPADVMRTGQALPDTGALQAELDRLEKSARRTPLAEAETHLKGLQSQYETMIREVEQRVAPVDVQGLQSQRNLRGSGGGRSKGRAVEGRGVGKAVKPSTIGSEVRRLAEQKVDDLIRANPDDPAVQRFAQIREDMTLLRQAIELAGRAKSGDVFLEPGEQGTARLLSSVLGTKSKEGRRITALKGQLAEADKRLEEFYRQSEESFYLPFVPKRHAKTLPRQLIRSARFGPFGVPMPRALPELRHVFTGKSIIAGDFRVDATALAGEAYGKTVRLVSIRNDHARLMKMAKDTQAQAGPFAVPIRSIDDIPAELKQRLSKIDDGEFTARDAASLSDNQRDAILRELYPDPAEALDNVKWVDARLIADEGIRTDETGRIVGRTFQSSPVAGVFDVLNEPFRFSYLFLRPAYALNLLGNAGMAVIHQGVFVPLNLARALKAADLYGPDVARAFDALVGEGKSAAFARTAGESRLTAASRTVAHSWSILTDRHFRRAALIHELRRQGFRSADEIRGALFDDKHATKLVEAKKRANKAMVEFDNLTHYEKAVLRHVIFVYPWVSRSAVWSVRTLIEHPVQAAILAELGHEAQHETEPIFGHTPDWLKRVGYIPVGFTADGSPKIVNPTSVNTFGTLNDFLQLGRGGETPEDFSSPVIEIGIRAFTGADQYGQRYKGGALGRFVTGPLGGSVKQIPLVRGFAGPKAQPKPTALDLKSREALVKQEHAALKESVLGGGWLGNWGSVIAGGLSPRELNLPAAYARYWRDQPDEARNKHERDLIQQGLTLQGQLLLKRDVPKALREAVNIAGEETLARSQRAKEIGRDVPANSKEGALVDIGVLQKHGKLSTLEASDLKAKLEKLPDAQAVSRFVRNLHVDHGGAELVGNWQSDVNVVASFTPEAAKARFADLRKQGLVGLLPAKPKQQDLYEIGRQVVAYRHEIEQRKQRYAGDQSAARSVAETALRAYQDEQDKPIAIGGEKFPSAVRLDWAMKTPQEQADHRVSIFKADWKGLTAFDKELLGKRSSATVTRGWSNLAQIVAAYRGQVPMAGIPSLPPGQRLAHKQLVYLVKYVDKGEAGYLEPSPGFFKDWLFAEQPRYKRLQTLGPVTKSKFHAQWNHLFVDANVLGRHIGGGVYSNSELTEAWHGYVNGSEFQGWLKRTPAGFRRELDQYGPDFLTGLLN